MKKRREDSFFGLHFDFHARPGQTGIGKNCDGGAIEELLEAVRPDYVQCDTKGHPGIASYPTKVGHPAPEQAADILRIWRDATEKHEVALYAHHSGVWDSAVAAEHPEWAVVRADGSRSPNNLSVFGPYCEEFLVPQLAEIACDYKLDGAWVDGECWATEVDYSDWATSAYRERFGEEPPRPDEPNYRLYQKFLREGFKDYIARYIAGLRRLAPSFQIASNWLYTSYVPEDPVLPVDFISGDFSPSDSLNSARFEGRCMQDQGLPWDLMSWGFTISSKDHISCVKEYAQLCQEAASVVMLGGGFQLYNKEPAGDFQRWAVPVWAKLAQFCRERQELCWKAQPVPQVAVVFSEKAYYENKKTLFHTADSRCVAELRGLLLCLLDAGFSVEVLMTHTVNQMPQERLDSYGAILLPDCEAIESGLRSNLLGYAERGGKLIITGYSSAELFLPYLDVDVTGGVSDSLPLFIEHGGRLGTLLTPHRRVNLISEKTSPYGFFYTDDMLSEGKCIASSVTEYGAGRIAGVYFDLGGYASCKTAAMRDFIRDTVLRLWTPDLSVKCDCPLDLSYMTKDGRLLVNLLNTAGFHSDARYMTTDVIPPARDVEISIALSERPKSVYLEPSHTPLPFNYADGKLTTKVARVDIHAVVTIEQ